VAAALDFRFKAISILHILYISERIALDLKDKINALINEDHFRQCENNAVA
jgi:hypothetical protein